MKLISVQETEDSRIYNFVDMDEKSNSMIHRQLENRNGKIFMRAKRRSSLQI